MPNGELPAGPDGPGPTPTPAPGMELVGAVMAMDIPPRFAGCLPCRCCCPRPATTRPGMKLPVNGTSGGGCCGGGVGANAGYMGMPGGIIGMNGTGGGGGTPLVLTAAAVG